MTCEERCHKHDWRGMGKNCSRPYQSERDIKELFREEIAKWKDEDPLFMAYVYGQEAGKKDERDKVLDKLREKYVEFLNHPCLELADKYKHCCDVEWCGLCTLDEVLEELRQQGR